MRLAEDPFEVADQSFPRRRIERGEGLVEKDDLRFRHEGPGKARPLRLAAGELPGRPPGEWADAEKIQITGNGPFDLRPPQTADPEAGSDIVEDRRIEEERLLKNHRDMPPVVKIALARIDFPLSEEDPPLERLQQTGERQEECGLPRPVRTDQRQDLPRIDGKGGNVKDAHPAPADLKVFNPQQYRRTGLGRHRGLSRCWICVRMALMRKVRIIRMIPRAMAISKFPRLVSITVAVVRTRE